MPRTTRLRFNPELAPWDRLDDNAPFIDGVGPKFHAAGIPVDIVFEQGRADLGLPAR